MVDSIFSHPWFVDFILPFLLVFTLIFAILEKSKLLGEEKRQINAIVSLVIGLIFVSVGYGTGIIVQLSYFLVVCIVILFVFMLIFGFATNKTQGDMLNKGLKIALGIIFGIAVIVAVLLITGWWDIIYDFVTNRGLGQTILINLFILAIIGGAIAVVMSSGGKGEKKG